MAINYCNATVGVIQHIWRDALGRVFRKADSYGIYQDNATHYYYTFSALAQEYDEHLVSEWPVDDFEFDYLRGFDGHVLRRRDVEDADPDRQPLKDLLASPLNLVNADDGVMSADTSGYTFDAWGESFAAGDEDGQPSETNHIRYHGAFTEEFVSSGDTDGVYRMGARHYSTVLGRFFQREPMTLVGLPSPANPLGVNAYLYSHNSPTTTSDISGLQTMNVSSGGILYPPEKPEVQPYEPLPDPDPGFDPPWDFPNKFGTMALQNPWGTCPWWDRRPLPDICMGINLPEFWATPELIPPGMLNPGGGIVGSGAGGGRQFVNVGGGSSSGGGGGGNANPVNGGQQLKPPETHAMMNYQGPHTAATDNAIKAHNDAYAAAIKGGAGSQPIYAIGDEHIAGGPGISGVHDVNGRTTVMWAVDNNDPEYWEREIDRAWGRVENYHDFAWYVGECALLVLTGGLSAPMGLSIRVTRCGVRMPWHNAKLLGHIFSRKAGHVRPGSKYSKKRFGELFEFVASNRANRITVTDPDAIAAGVREYRQYYSGSSVWVQVNRKGWIKSGAVNRY